MRGVRKSRSPVDVGKSGHPRLTLAEAAEALRMLLGQSPPAEHVKRARSAFDDLERPKLRPILLADQHRLCVYCEVELVDDPADPLVVEHWEPVGKAPERALHWENLYLSCRSPYSCDEKKGGRRLAWDDADPSLPLPCHHDYERCLGFGRGGDVYVKKNANLTAAQRRALELAIEDRDDRGRTRSSLLGLNSPALVKARKEAMDRERSRLQREFGDKDATPADRAAAERRLLVAGPREGFVSVRVAWWTRQLGKDRP